MAAEPAIDHVSSGIAPRPTTNEIWGYSVWLFALVIFSIPESWAGFGNPPWPTLSDTVGHLESLWSGTRIVVVVLIVFVIFQVVKFPPGQPAAYVIGARHQVRARTASGRLTQQPAEITEISAVLYLAVALAVIAGGSLIAANASSDMWVLGYVIYGLFFMFLVLIPNALAFWFARDMAFPTFFRTIADLERRWRPAAMVIVAALVVLLLHLVFFPWPDISI